MKRMLINATQPEELRVALVDGQRLYDVDIESTSREQKKSNIYKGKVVRIEPSLEAAFVDFGAERHGFLPFKEIARSLFKEQAGRGRFNVKDHLQVGQELIIQVEKPERGNKGAALTTFISLAGRYLVLMPNNPRAGGVSRQIEGDDRSEAREAMSGVNIPQGMGMILRTAGVGKSTEELQWDLDYLLQVWKAIEKAASERPAPFLIYRESEVIIRAIRDYLRQDINEILIDNKEVYDRANEFMQQVMPHNLGKLKLYTERDPLFTRYQVESQIESAFAREVTLPSGGAVIIDHTEALITIDINSARATAGGDIEETALNTNLEAAEEIARQLRLRDIGGLIVIDFIDMMNPKNQRDVENKLRDCVKDDRARVQVNRISRFGLLEMSRQRLRPSLGESSYNVCPRCSGTGHLRSVESLSLSVFRLIEEEAMKENTLRVIAQLPVEVASFLLNEKRKSLQDIEERLDVDIVLVPNPELETPRYKVQRIRQNEELQPDEQQQSSYKLTRETEEAVETDNNTWFDRRTPPQPAVQQVMHAQPMPVRETPLESTPDNETAVTQQTKAKGLISRLFGNLFSIPEDNGGDSRHDTHQDNQQPRAPRKAARSSEDKELRDSDSSSTSNSRSRRNKRNDNTGGEDNYSSEGRKSRSGSRRGRRGGRRRRRSDGSSDNSDNSGSGSQNNGRSGSDNKSEDQNATAARKPAPRTGTASRATGQNRTVPDSTERSKADDQAQDTGGQVNQRRDETGTVSSSRQPSPTDSTPARPVSPDSRGNERTAVKETSEADTTGSADAAVSKSQTETQHAATTAPFQPQAPDHSTTTDKLPSAADVASTTDDSTAGKSDRRRPRPLYGAGAVRKDDNHTPDQDNNQQRDTKLEQGSEVD